MTDQSKKQSDDAGLHSSETNLFGALFGFHTKATTLLRQSGLPDEKRDLVSKRMMSLLDETTAEIKRTENFSNMAGRLELAYEEIKRLVDELAGSRSRGPDNPEA